jgi:hypothetical protein
MQARYYDPVIGRFYSNDPADAIEHMGGAGGIHGFNRYAYANNNPYKYTDPDGRKVKFIGGSKAPFQQVYNHMIQNSSSGATILNELVNSTEVFELSLTTGDTAMSNATWDQNAKIEWNPNQGITTQTGATQSPAVGLIHEAIHALNPEMSEGAVTAQDNKVAGELGEGQRRSYIDVQSTDDVSGPLCRSNGEGGETCG